MAHRNTRIITPVEESWDDWFDSPRATDDLFDHRDQPADQHREHFE